MSLFLFVLKRLGRGVLTIWFAVTVTFLLLRLLPGDPALALASPNMTAETRAALLTQYGLDQPLPVQYGLVPRAAAAGQPRHLVHPAHPASPTCCWSGCRGPCCWPASPLLVTIADRHPARCRWPRPARAGSSTALVQIVGVTGQSLFVPSVGDPAAVRLRAAARLAPDRRRVHRRHLRRRVVRLSVLSHLVLPCLSLMLVQLGSYVLTMRSTLIEALGEDYVTLARANGLPHRGCCGSTRCATRCCRPRR